MWYTYLLLCSDKYNSLYCGITNNLEKRIGVHNSGKGAKYTRGRLPVTLYCYFEFETKSEALKEELRIKNLSRAEKLKLK